MTRDGRGPIPVVVGLGGRGTQGLHWLGWGVASLGSHDNRGWEAPGIVTIEDGGAKAPELE